MKQEIAYLSRENDRLEGVERDYEQVREVLGDEAVDRTILMAERGERQERSGKIKMDQLTL